MPISHSCGKEQIYIYIYMTFFQNMILNSTPIKLVLFNFRQSNERTERLRHFFEMFSQPFGPKQSRSN